MAKRVRGSRSSHRPGGQGPSRTKKTSDDAASVSADAAQAAPGDDVLTDADYSEVEVDEVAAAAVAATSTTAAAEASEAKPRRRRDRRRVRKQRPDDLEARAKAETVWVRSDLRRIGIISVILFVALAVCWVIFGVIDVLNVY